MFRLLKQFRTTGYAYFSKNDFFELLDIELSAYKPTANNRFIDDIQSTYQKILGLRFGSRSKDGLDREMFVMFTRFEIKGSADVPYVDIQIYPKALKLLIISKVGFVML